MNHEPRKLGHQKVRRHKKSLNHQDIFWQLRLRPSLLAYLRSGSISALVLRSIRADAIAFKHVFFAVPKKHLTHSHASPCHQSVCQPVISFDNVVIVVVIITIIVVFFLLFIIVIITIIKNNFFQILRHH